MITVWNQPQNNSNFAPAADIVALLADHGIHAQIGESKMPNHDAILVSEPSADRADTLCQIHFGRFKGSWDAKLLKNPRGVDFQPPSEEISDELFI